MRRERLDALLSEIRAFRQETLLELDDLTEEEFPLPTGIHRWDEVRRLLLRFGEHMQEHATQIEGTRAAIGRDPTMPRRMLAQSEIAWGRLLAATVGLEDDDLTDQPPSGGWTVRQTLEHIRDVERGYLEGVRKARRGASSEVT